ncbi:active breakpoint cluster region-related protein-like [Ornithodoros turicata]|uniref:active breakpoint cluster region-related protein-like n=1 Tax=Ornithodoros turicata TaxID=34597 RepID=UPI003139D434
METFNDLQRNWAERFPHSKLSLIWEEDVRTLLATHRQRVAQLKEELEQEEFLVGYFETYLAGAGRVKKTSSSKLNQCERQNGDTPHNSDGVAASNGLSNSLDASVLKSDKSLASKQSDEDIPNVSDTTKKSQGARNSTGEVDKPYVTVIAVSGISRSSSCDNAPSSSTKDKVLPTSQSLDRPDHQDSPQPRRKKPPTPPPKRCKWPPPSGAATSEYVSPREGQKTKERCDKTVEKHEADTVEAQTCKQTEAPMAFSTFRPPPTEAQVFPSAPAAQDADEGSALHGSAEFTDDDVIYDTVAFDEEASWNGAGTEDDEAVDPDYVEFGKFVGSTSQARLSDGEQLDVVSALNTRSFATYENIALLKASDSMDSEEEDGSMLRSMSSDADLDHDGMGTGTTSSDQSAGARSDRANGEMTVEEILDADSGVYSSSVESASFLSSGTPPVTRKINNEAEQNGVQHSEDERTAMCKRIVSSIIESETAYVDCLDTLNQYAKALSSAIGTNQSVLSKEEIDVIFFKIEQLHETHRNFRDGLRRNLENWDSKPTIGENFKFLASRLQVYKLFLENYSKAIETVRHCNSSNIKFEELFKNIKLNTARGQAATLEDLLHKPVARVQKNALVLHDLLHYIPSSHPDYNNLKTALKLTQRFLNELKLNSAESMFPHQDRAPRHVVKNSFIVEYSEGHRKLRHLFLFNDVIVCAKYKPSSRQKFTFEVKWYIPLSDVTLMDAEGEAEPIREDNKMNICQLRSRASTLRDLVMKEERDTARAGKAPPRNLERNRKKLSELEAQLVLHSPNLPFKIGYRSSKTYAFFLSSEFERAQWIEAINVLQSSAPQTASTPSLLELQSCITSTRGCMGTNMGSFLSRTAKDEDLLVGDLHIMVHNLQGLTRPTDIFVCFEVDSYGHFFKKGRTKTCHNTVEPIFSQEVVIDLDGSQTLRILCYEENEDESTMGPLLRGKASIEMSRSWLTDKYQEKSISLQECTLNISIKYISSEITLHRVPSCKPIGTFGMKVQQVCKKEKSRVPFVITCCVREVERRGINEVGIYRVSGSTSDVQRLKRTFENDPYEAEQLMKEVDVNNVTGLLKLYLRELPEALFTDALYPKLFEAFNKHDQEEKRQMLLGLFAKLPEINQNVTVFLIDHMVKINSNEAQNKMSLHNLATVFGPTIIRPASHSSNHNPSDLLTTSTVDVMAQAGILYFFLRRRAAGMPLQLEAEAAPASNH